MKKTYSLPTIQVIICILIISASYTNFCFGANISSSTNGGKWSSTTTWTGGVIPGAGDVVTIASPVTIDAGDTRTCTDLKINAGKTLTNNGTLTITGTNSLPGALTQGVNATLTINGTFASTLNASASGNTVHYTGSNNQPLKSSTYYKLKVSNSTKTSSGPIIVKDSLVANSFMNLSGSLTIEGNAIFFDALNTSSNLSITGNAIFYNYFTSTGDATTIEFQGNLIINGNWDNNSYTSNFYFYKNITNNGTFSSGNGIYTFNGKTTINSSNDLYISNIVVTDTLINNTNLFSDYISGAGDFINMSNSKLSYWGASIEPTLTANSSNNTVEYWANNAYIKSATYDSLTLWNTEGSIQTAEGNITASKLYIDSQTTLDMASYQLNGLTNTNGAGSIQTQNTSSTPLPDNVTWPYSIAYNGSGNQTVTTGNYLALNLSGGNTKTLNGPITLSNLQVNSGTTFDLGTNMLPACTHSGTGTILTQNTSLTPIPAEDSWTYTINFNGVSTQNLVNGTYSNITIDNSSGVYVTDSATINNTLTINSGKKLIIEAGKSLTAQTIINNGGAAGLSILASDTNPAGTLIFYNSGTSVPATVQLYTKAYAATNNNGTYSNYKWQFFGIPVNSLTANPTFNNSYLRKYNEAGTGSGSSSSNRWITVPSSATMTAFTGYEITQPSAKTISIAGNLVNSNYSSGKLSVTPTAEYPGQHLIGNPYTASIYIPAIQFGSTDQNIIENTIYLYNTGTYNEWIGSGSGNTSGESAGQYTVIPKNAAGTGGIPDRIASMQAFLVAAVSDNAAATVSIPYSSVSRRNTTMMRSAQKQSQNPYLKIKASGSRFSDNTWIILADNCSTNYDNGWDGYKIGGSTLAPQLWAQEGSNYLQIDAKNSIDNTLLGFYKGEDSGYTLTFLHSENEPQFSSLYLTDLYTTTITDISANGSTYTFTANDNAPLNRFRISTSIDTPTANPNSLSNNIYLYNVGKTIHLQSLENTNINLTITDLSGKRVVNTQLHLDGKQTIQTNLNSGMYIVTANGDDTYLTKRIIIP